MPEAVFRVILLASGLGYAALTLGFLRKSPWAISLWPWADTPLSYIFLGSITGAFAAGALWAAVQNRLSAVQGSLVGLTAIYAGSALALLRLDLPAGSASRTPAVAAAVVALGAALLFPVARRQPRPPGIPLEPLVRWSCGIFALALAAAGAALLARLPNIFPWPLSPPSSTLFGLVFCGLSVVYAQVCWSGWRDAAVITMAGFLVYDLILLPPFLRHFAKVAPEKLPSLGLYTAVLVYSAALALWFLIWRRAFLAPSGPR